ncbi:hypothetical protein K9M50_00530 [Patescibacteria group bacterium]|nr:hypothetical protein [Patescibacteria group bacterium]
MKRNRVVMKRNRSVKSKKITKVFNLLLLFNPLIVVGLCLFITPWFSWLTFLLALIFKTNIFRSISSIRNKKLKNKLENMVFIIHALMSLFALGFTIYAIWPSLYANIWQEITWALSALWQVLTNNYWLLAVFVLVVFLIKLSKFNLKAVEKISKNAKPWIIYLKVSLTANKLEKLETLLLNKFYSRKIFKRYFKLAITEKALFNKERGEFVESVLSHNLRINIVLFFLEIFADKYKDERNTKFVKEKFHQLASIVNSAGNKILKNRTELTNGKREEMYKEQFNFAKKLFKSPLTLFNYSFDVESLVSLVIDKSEEERKEKEEKDGLRKRKIAEGNVDEFIKGYSYFYCENLFKEFFKNLSLKKFEDKKIIEVSRLKGDIWNNNLDIFFDRVSFILQKTRNDEFITIVVNSIEKLVQQIEQVGHDDLKKVIRKKQREILNIIST